MKVVYVLNGYFPKYIGGSEVYTHALAKYMKNEGHEVSVIVPVYDLNEDNNLNYEYEDIPIQQYVDKSKSSRLYKIGLEKPEGLNRYINLLKQIKPDIVHFQMISTSACITMYHVEETKKLGIKTALTIHMSHYTCITENLLRNNKYLCDGKIEPVKCTICYLKSKKIISPLAEIISIISLGSSLFLKNSRFFLKLPILSSAALVHFKRSRLHIIEKNIDKIIPITNWYKKILLLNKVSEKKISVVKQALIDHDTDIENVTNCIDNNALLKLIFVGRICEIKGLHILISALKIISSQDYLLDIYGPYNNQDPYYKKCIAEIKKYNLSINIKGTIEQKIVPQTIKNYDFLCLPSVISEMSPLVIQEAFKVNVPVIGSNVTGITEMVSHGKNGYIFKFGDYKELGKLLLQVITHKLQNKELVTSIQQPRNFNEVGSETLTIYKKLIK